MNLHNYFFIECQKGLEIQSQDKQYTPIAFLDFVANTIHTITKYCICEIFGYKIPKIVKGKMAKSKSLMSNV